METHRRSCEDRGWKVHMHVKDTDDPSNHRGSQETGMEHSPSPWTSRGLHHDCRCPACRNVGNYTSVVLRCPFVVSPYISPGKQNQQWTCIFNHTGKSQQNLLVCLVRSLCYQSVRWGPKALLATYSHSKLWWCHFPTTFHNLDLSSEPQTVTAKSAMNLH